jgi:hypothetical protein
MILLITLPPLAYVEGIERDGIVDEAEWTWLFKDASQKPYFDVYWYKDSEDLCLAIVTDDTSDNTDLLEFAFRATDIDYLIQLKPGISVRYRSSGGDWNGWWQTIHNGLPPKVNIGDGKTNGYRSYEISIHPSLLGDKATDFPNNFVFWIKIQDGAPNGPINYYPDSRAGWWFDIAAGRAGREEIPEFEGNEQVPEFHIPELPFGPVMAILSMVAAIALYKRKPILGMKI